MNEKDETLRTPEMDEKNDLMLSESELANIEGQLTKSRGGAPCPWCGNTRWKVYNSVLTHTLFSIPKNVHVHNKVAPFIGLECLGCGRQDSFGLHFFGLKTGLVKKEPENDS